MDMNHERRRLIVVASNRGPLSFSFAADGSLTARRGGGGMVSALMSGLAELSGDDDVRWICAALNDADRQAASEGMADGGGPAVQMLSIPPGTLGDAYNGVANSVLWFTHHMLFDTPSQPRFDRTFRDRWAGYVAYNQAFSDALATAARGGGGQDARALVQDYHLALAPRLLRDAGTGIKIAHFSHTPWAPPAYYRLLPDDVAGAILDGILGADHAGFLAPRWAEAFLDCCAAVLGADIKRQGDSALVRHRGHTTEVAVHPLGVDAAALRARAREGDVLTHAATLTEAARGRQLIVRVDRTELSKNIVGGLAAYRELLATRPEWHGKISHLALAYPSRSDLPEYQAYNELVADLAREINAEFGTADWEPLTLEVKDDYPRSLAACRVADVLLVNPIRDGMNLVAEEGPILSDRGCALVLSREAGAAAVLGDDALQVNPFDVSATADALHHALIMPAGERQRRAEAIAATATGFAPKHWLSAQLAALG
jgi:trehalose 6-phosphate synthase